MLSISNSKISLQFPTKSRYTSKLFYVESTIQSNLSHVFRSCLHSPNRLVFLFEIACKQTSKKELIYLTTSTVRFVYGIWSFLLIKVKISLERARCNNIIIINRWWVLLFVKRNDNAGRLYAKHTKWTLHINMTENCYS